MHPESGRSATGKIADGKITSVTTFDLNDGATVFVVSSDDSSDAYRHGGSFVCSLGLKGGKSFALDLMRLRLSKAWR